MRIPRLVPTKTTIPFMRWRMPAMGLSALLFVLSVLLAAVHGFNFGIDFRGGTIVEVRMPQAADLATMRDRLSGLGLGEVALQEFGEPTDVLIRIERQVGDEAEQQQAVTVVREALVAEFGNDVEFRRAEYVGPRVSEELLRDGMLATVVALVGVILYLWFRFEWQFGVGAIAALIHDTALTLGIFSLTGLEFNLSTVAAILTIIGYSLNDTVVIYDRVRENLRRYKKMPLLELLDVSLNETLSRTVMTSLSTLLALFALYFLGGEVIRGFTFAMIWGIFVGTYSTVFIATPLLLYFNLRSSTVAAPEASPASS